MSWVLELESERNLPAVREGPVSSPEMCLLRDADDADVFPIIKVGKDITDINVEESMG